MGFFDELDAVCNAQNAHLDQLFAQQQADAAATQAREEEEKKTKRRNWAVGVLEEGKISLNQVNKITSAMMIVNNRYSSHLLTKPEKLFSGYRLTAMESAQTAT